MEYSGHFLSNIAQFAALLRRAGLDVSVSDSLKACETLAHLPISERQTIHAGLKACMLRRPEDQQVFDEVFQMFFRDPDLFERLLSPLMPQKPGEEEDQRPTPKRRVQDAFSQPRHLEEPEEPELDMDREGSSSLMELIGQKDFEQMSSEEFRQAMLAIHDLMLHLPRLDSRRRQWANKGKADFARSLRAQMRQPFQAGQLVHTKNKQELMPLVILVDISGSMERYARMFLHFMHGLGQKHRKVDMFTFGTKLTHITKFLRSRDVDLALDHAGKAVRDWSGGTQIGASLQVFLKNHARSMPLARSHVIIMTDGLERGDVTDTKTAMERLHLRSRKITWLNPLLRYDGFEPKARGIQAMMPHIDELRPVHNLHSLSELARSLRP